MVKRMVRQREKLAKTGSPAPGEPLYLAVGFLRRPHGVLGEMIMDVLTDFPERLGAGKEVFAGESHESLTIRSLRPHNAGALIAFEGLMDCDVVGRLRNTTIYIFAHEVPALPDGEYYFHDLLGLSVITENGDKVGSLIEILETGANDVYVIRSEAGKEVLVPAIDDVILHIDLEQKVMQIRLQNWL